MTKPSRHCQWAANRGMTALRLLRNAFDRIDVKNFKLLFTTYVRPHLEYCIQAVGPHTVQDMKTLERVQRRTTKLVKAIRNMSHEDRLRTLKLPSIEERIRRGDMIETYKLLTGKVGVNHEQFFEVTHQNRTRGHGLKLIKKRAKHVSRLTYTMAEEHVTHQSSRNHLSSNLSSKGFVTFDFSIISTLHA